MLLKIYIKRPEKNLNTHNNIHVERLILIQKRVSNMNEEKARKCFRFYSTRSVCICNNDLTGFFTQRTACEYLRVYCTKVKHVLLYSIAFIQYRLIFCDIFKNDTICSMYTESKQTN